MKAEKDLRKVLRALKAEVRRPCDSAVEVVVGGRRQKVECLACNVKKEELHVTIAVVEWVLEESPEGDRWEERVLEAARKPQRA
jgi:acylphosphatase